MGKPSSALPVYKFDPEYPLVTHNEFTIFAHGKDFDVDGFKRKTKLRFDQTWHAGEGNYTTNGVSKKLGDGLRLDYGQQQLRAIRFCKRNTEELKLLSSHPGVTSCILGLQHLRELTTNSIYFSFSVSPSLTWHVLNVGFTIVHYVSVGNPPHRSYRAVSSLPTNHTLGPATPRSQTRAQRLRFVFTGLALKMLALLRNHSRREKHIAELDHILTGIGQLIGPLATARPEVTLALLCDLIISHPEIFQLLEEDVIRVQEMLARKNRPASV